MKLPLGISSWSVPWACGVPGYACPPNPLTAMDLLRLARDLDVRVLQIADNLPLDAMSRAERAELKAAAGEYGIQLEAGTRGVQPDHLLRCLEIAVDLDARILRTLTQSAGFQPDIHQAAGAIRRVVNAFEKAGVAIAIENSEAHAAEEYDWLMREIPSPCLGICLDTANSLGRQEGLRYVATRLAPHTINLHVKDFDITRISTRMGFSIVGRPAGEGRVDLAWLFETLASNGRDPSVILEHWPPFAGTIEETVALEAEWLARSVRNLKAAVSSFLATRV